MSVLRNLETKIAGLVEGYFGRVFRTEVRPVELARKLAKEMDEHRTVSLSRTYVPNEYVIWLSPEDRAHYEGVEKPVIDELSGYLLEYARREKLALVSRPVLEFRTDERLSLGEFGIQARTIKPPENESARAEQGDHGDTMIYSAVRPAESSSEPRGRTGRAVLVAGGKRLALSSGGGIVGRSRDSDVVLSDASVSRRHAEIRPSQDGWVITDLRSTNGVRVNGRAITRETPISSGDRIDIGTVTTQFEVE
jgi:FHA domain-containing protein